MDPDLLKKIVYASFRRAWEEDRGGFPPPSDTIYVTEVSQAGFNELLRNLHQTIRSY